MALIAHCWTGLPIPYSIVLNEISETPNTSMALKDFIDKHNIDIKALERMRKRVFVVGRFNNDPLHNQGIVPDLYLFTNRNDLSDLYKENYKAIRRLDYGGFVSALQPRIAEKETVVKAYTDNDGKTVNLSKVELKPAGSSDSKDSYVINDLNYFFLRAISTTKQPHFTKDTDLPELLNESAGKTIYDQIRINLSNFCKFQPRTVELIEAIARLLGQCTGDEAIPPAYSYGEKLPVGFTDKLVDYLFAEGQEEFQLDGINFNLGVWNGFSSPSNSAKTREALVDIVTSFKNELLGYSGHFKSVTYTDGNLTDLTKANIKGELADEFRKAKDSYNMLRQIIRSKVLLSMVIEWILLDLRTVKSAKSLEEGTAIQNRAIEKAILSDWKDNDLAKPLRRPNKKERRSFSLSMGGSLHELIQAVLDEGNEKMNDLSAEMKKVAEAIKSDKKKLEDIRKLSNYSDKDPAKYKAFRGALEVIFMDVISPLLYKQPGLDLPTLKKRLKGQIMRTYLSAILLADDISDAFKGILTEEFLNDFDAKIDEETQMINDKDEVLAYIVGNVVNVLTKDDISTRLEEGIRVLNDIEVLKSEAQGNEIRLSDIVPTIPEVVTEGTVFEEESEQEELAAVLIQQTFKSKLTQQLAQHDVTAPSTAEGSTSEDVEDIETQVPKEASAYSKKIDEIVDFIVESDLQSEEQRSKVDVSTLTNKAFQKLKDEDSQEITRVSNDLSSYEQIMHKIYARYNDNPEADSFRNSVEGMTLMNLMKLFKDDLGLGKSFSYLYDLLIDLVIHLNADDPNASPRKFLQENSITKYFDDALFDDKGKGYSALINNLKAQGKSSLDNVVHFVSELRGIKYMLDSLKDDIESEVVFVNATATQFTNWVKTENLTPDFRVDSKSYFRMRAGFMVNGQSDKVIMPGLVYISDFAFPENLGNATSPAKKISWINSLNNFPMRQGGLAYTLPPMFLTTSDVGDPQWYQTGLNFGKAASTAMAPVFAIGPNLRLNEDKAFSTQLPAGYLFCVHYLSGGKEQAVKVEGGTGQDSKGRFKVVGTGSVSFAESLTPVNWGRGNENYGLVSDSYLYLILQLLVTAKYKGAGDSLDPVSFYQCFFKDDMRADAWESSKLLNQAIPGGNMLNLYTEHVSVGGDSKSLYESDLQNSSNPPINNPLTNVRGNSPEGGWRIFSDVNWFQRVCKALQLP